MENFFNLFLAVLFTTVAAYFAFTSQYIFITVGGIAVALFGVFVLISVIADIIERVL